MAINFGTSLVTNGLIMNVDFKNPRCSTGVGSGVNNLAKLAYSGFKTTGVAINNSSGVAYFSPSGCINFGDATPFRLPSANFCFNLWFYWDKIQKNRTIISKRNDYPYNQYSFSIGANSPTLGGDGKNLVTYVSTDNGGGVVAAAYNMVDNIESGVRYLSYNISPSTFKLYFDGVLKYSVGISVNGPLEIPSRPFVIGGLNLDGVVLSTFSGYMYQAHMYNRTLTDAEVLQNYNNTKIRFTN